MTEVQSQGSSLPQDLSRFLFLEETITGRRVLEVGATSGAVAEFLLELGAARVVCAMTDEALAKELKSANATRKIDFRPIDSDVLPGDDGAFDLVVDFSLSAAMAQGEHFRLSDINRVLSPDGFALTAIENEELAHLPTVFPGTDVERLPYRAFAEALHENFDVVQIYFQSLLLGYFFGAFDFEPDGNGIAPHTGLMQDEPEPASYYFFAFGNAVPIIEDVSLVQLPLSRLLQDLSLALPGNDTQTRALQQAAEQRGQEALEEAKAGEAGAREEARQEERARIAAEEALAVKAKEFSEERLLFEEREGKLQDVLKGHEKSIEEMAEQVPHLHVEVSRLSEVLKGKSKEHDETQTQLDHLHIALSSRDAQIGEWQKEIDAAKTQIQEFTNENSQYRDLIAERESWLTGSRAENDRLENELTELRDEKALLRQTLEEQIHHQRELEKNTEGTMRKATELDVQLTASLERTAGLQENLESAFQERDELQASQEHLQQDFAQSVMAAERLNQTHQEFQKAAKRQEEERLQEIRTLKQDSDAAKWKIAELEVAQNTLKEERARLAHGVNVLTTEKQEQSEKFKHALDEGQRAEKEHAEIGELFAAAEEEISRIRLQTDTLKEENEDLTREKEATQAAEQEAAASLRETSRQWKSSQIILEERERDLADEKNAKYEAMAQRDTLNALLGEREEGMSALREELESASKELEQKREEAQQGASAKIILDGRVKDFENEIETLKERLQQNSAVMVEEQQNAVRSSELWQAKEKENESLAIQNQDLRDLLDENQKDGLAVQHSLNDARREIEEFQAAQEILEKKSTDQESEHRLRQENLENRYAEAVELHRGSEEVSRKLHGELEEKFNAAESDWEDERASRDKAERLLRDENAEYDAQWKSTLAENESLHQNLREARQRLDEGEDDFSEAKNEVEELERALQSAKKKNEELQSAYDNLDLESDQHSDHGKRQEAELQKTRDSLEESTKSLEEFVGLAEDLERELEEERQKGLRSGDEMASQLQTHRELLAAQLEEAQKTLAVERARGDLFQAELEESQWVLGQEKVRGDLFLADLDESQGALKQEKARGDLGNHQLAECQRELKSVLYEEMGGQTRGLQEL